MFEFFDFFLLFSKNLNVKNKLHKIIMLFSKLNSYINLVISYFKLFTHASIYFFGLPLLLFWESGWLSSSLISFSTFWSSRLKATFLEFFAPSSLHFGQYQLVGTESTEIPTHSK